MRRANRTLIHLPATERHPDCGKSNLGSRLIVFATLLAAMLPAAAALGFELLRVNNNPCARDVQHLFWKDHAAAVDTSRLEPRFQQLADDARGRWNESLRGFTFRTRAAAAGFCSRDGVATIEFADTTCGGASFGDALAITRSVWNADGTSVDADVLFNAGHSALRIDAVFLEVALHELGHVLGLDHSDACGGSGAGTVMKSVLGFERLQWPQADDIAGAEFIYPPPSDGGVPAGANACAIVPPGARPRPALPFLAMPVLLLARLFLRSRTRQRIDGGAKLL